MGEEEGLCAGEAVTHGGQWGRCRARQVVSASGQGPCVGSAEGQARWSAVGKGKRVTVEARGGQGPVTEGLEGTRLGFILSAVRTTGKL